MLLATPALHMIGTQFMKCFKLFVNLVLFDLSLLVDFLNLLLEQSVDFSLQTSHVVPIVLLDDLLKFGLFPLKLGVPNKILTHSSGYFRFFAV